jgi:hypothetical protein
MVFFFNGREGESLFGRGERNKKPGLFSPAYASGVDSILRLLMLLGSADGISNFGSIAKD